MCSAFRSAALSRKKSRFRRPTSSANWCWSAPARAVAKAWPREARDDRAAGREFLKRFRRRAENRDPEVNEKVAPAQIEAISEWGAPRQKSFEYLKSIRQPTLVVNGGNDVIIYAVNSFILQQHLPNAQLILYPDANHGSQYQYPNEFVADVTRFLNDEVSLSIQKGNDHG